MGAKGSFRKGADQAKSAQKSGFSRVDYFQISDEDEAILRFITDAREDSSLAHVDAWITVDQHQMVPTKLKPDGYEGKWPTSMSAVCRYDEAFAGIYEDCFVCDKLVDDDRVRKPGPRIWALAAHREKVIGDGTKELGGPENEGKLVGYTDQTRKVEVKVDGKTKTVVQPNIVIVNMGWRNFFSPLDGFANQYGTVLDRDYWIRRSGGGTDTTYQIVALDPIPGYDLRDPEVMEKYASNLDLGQIVSDMASDKYYGRFFDTRVTVSDDDDDEETTSSVSAKEQQKPEGDASPDKLKALVDRVKGGKSEASAESPAEEKVEGSSTGLINISG